MYNNESRAQSYGISSYMRTHNLLVTAHLHCVTFREFVTIKGLAIDMNCQLCICAFPHFVSYVKCAQVQKLQITMVWTAIDSL